MPTLETLTLILLLPLLPLLATSTPLSQSILKLKVPTHPEDGKGKFNPLAHLSAISPFFIPAEEPTPLPHKSCKVSSTSILIRHSSILGNDDEYEQFMLPLTKKLLSLPPSSLPVPPPGAPIYNHTEQIARWKAAGGSWDGNLGLEKWFWLKEWKEVIVEDELEVLSERGKGDATALGKFIHSSYPHLFPPSKPGKDHLDSSDSDDDSDVCDDEDEDEDDDIFASLKSKKHHKDKKHKSKHPKDPKTKKPILPYQVWTASSARDIDTSKAYIKGAFPPHQAGKDGEGDGKHVQLVKVPNKLKNGWRRSLTPHKACSAFEKESSLEPAAKWLHTFAPGIRKRIEGVVPEVGKVLEDEDVLGMAMLCGYETIKQDWSGFCGVFSEDEWRDLEYYFDVRFHYMMGYGNPLSTYLGAPWVKTARHLLAGEVEDDKDGDGRSDDPDHPGKFDLTQSEDDVWAMKKKKGGDGLPKPKIPPNGTHTQLLHAFFTHRESPAFVSTTLNLYNFTSPETQSKVGPAASLDPPLDHRPEPRQWRTSEVVSFLGHVALERFTCSGLDDDDEEPHTGLVNKNKKNKGKDGDGDEVTPSYVRVMVNGRQAVSGGCEDGPKGSCKWKTWKTWIDERVDRWGDFQGVCEKDEK